MFTGIVEEIGHVDSIEPTLSNCEIFRFVFEAQEVLTGLKIGDSVSISGCCLTVVELGEKTFSVDVVQETLARTNLGNLKLEDRINLERAAKVGGRLDGHIVQGHIDTTVTVLLPPPRLKLEVEPPFCRYIVEKGSVTLDGVSLTVAAVDGNSFEVAVVPHTLEVTTLGNVNVWDKLNLEVDILAKYLERLLKPQIDNKIDTKKDVYNASSED